MWIILAGLLGIMITHSRETYQPTSIMRWDRGIFNGSNGGNPYGLMRSAAQMNWEVTSGYINIWVNMGKFM